MNIIHLLSQNHLTGSEVYASTLIHRQLIFGHHIYQISNDFFYPTDAVKFKLDVETKSRLTFIKNILWLRNFIRKQNIHIIHTHSRASAKLAYWATLFTNTAQVSTVHGVQHSSLSKKIHNQYGQFIFAVCENLKDHLVDDFSYKAQKIHVLRNPISPNKYRFISCPSNEIKKLKIAVIGRGTGPKRNRTEQVLNALNDFNADLFLIGAQLEQLKLDNTFKKRINVINSTELNSDLYSQFDVVIGSGRVCMEAIITGVKTIAFGEACYIGLVTKENFNKALESNFGDIHPNSQNPELDSNKLIKDLSTNFSEHEALAEMAKKEFSLEIISTKIQRLYESAFFLKNYNHWIPILMYHKIPKNEIKSRHRIYVTQENFEKHLAFFKSRGFQTLTFSDLNKFRTAKKSFKEFPKKPLILTFDDGYQDNLENASPLLKKYGFKSQIFLLADKNINSNTWDINSSEPSHSIIANSNRQKWGESEFEIGSHGFKHQKITDMSYSMAFTELTESKKLLEQEFKIPINVFAFTYGLTNESSAELAQAAGYDYAVNTDTGGFLIEEDPYRIFRVSVFPNENWWSLFKKTSRWYRKYYYLKRKK